MFFFPSKSVKNTKFDLAGKARNIPSVSYFQGISISKPYVII